MSRTTACLMRRRSRLAHYRRWRVLLRGPTLALTVIAGALSWAAVPAQAQTASEFSDGIRGYPYAITQGSDGNMWFTELAGSGIGRIAPDGSATEHASGMPDGLGTNAIATGADGNIWYTASTAVGDPDEAIGRMTPSGFVTIFTAGLSHGARLGGITAGPDGNLWFTETGGARIGRITPAGAVTEFAAGITPGSQPIGIAAAADGNLWFAEAGIDRIGRITPDGVVTEFGAGITPGTRPSEIAAGADGNVWFTQPGGGNGSFDRIGRITPAGFVTEFVVGTDSNGCPGGIAAGPDGNMWFTECARGVGRITPSGTITEFRDGITSFSSSHDIAAGSDGSMWFTEGNAGVNRIGRIATGETPPPPPPPPPPGPPPPPPNGPFVTVETAVATVDARGRATIVLACTRLVARCDGQMLLTRSQPLPLAPILPSPPIEFAKTSFSIPAAVATPVAVQLNVVAQSLLALAPGRSLTVDASVQVSNVVGGRQIVLTRATR